MGALVAGLFLAASAVSSLWAASSPRAPAAPPQQIRDVRITNVRDSSFAVSWLTTFSTTGEVRYGSNPASLVNVRPDDRGASTTDDTHYVTVSSLMPSTTYYFDVVSSPITDTNSGAHYSVTTGATLSVPPTPDFSYGQVTKSGGTTPANGAIVYITLARAGTGERSAPMSALLQSGYWWANLANARSANLAGYFGHNPAGGDSVELTAQAGFDGRASQTVDTAADSPAATMTLSTCILQQDYNCNCQVDLDDLSDIVGRWNVPASDPAYAPAYDYDGDTVIRAYDLMQVAAYLDKVCF